MRGNGNSDVPCGECTVCCKSSQFIYVGPEETATLAHIPRGLLFQAPGRDGFVLGYNEDGGCPMFVGNACSIYAHRPRTCRTYDCRIFPATGIVPDANKPEIVSRAASWEFSFATARDRLERDALRAAAESLGRHPELFPGKAIPPPTQLAALAVRLRSLFLTPPGNPASLCEPPLDVLKREIERIRSAGFSPPNSA